MSNLVYVLSYVPLAMQDGSMEEYPEIFLFFNENDAKIFAVKNYYHKAIEEFVYDDIFTRLLMTYSPTQNLLKEEKEIQRLFKSFLIAVNKKDFEKAWETARIFHEKITLHFLLEIQEKEIT